MIFKCTLLWNYCYNVLILMAWVNSCVTGICSYLWASYCQRWNSSLYLHTSHSSIHNRTFFSFGDHIFSLLLLSCHSQTRKSIPLLSHTKLCIITISPLHTSVCQLQQHCINLLKLMNDKDARQQNAEVR